ncbi:LacI family DNA-binding transcriptional regulator [Saccharopolyspora pogona]|uniref:LacI family DNA-binding transcriptional regulator n=1 Tax=Saccharopolyspora pogona TaxID=333966 RepID=UPI0016892527|nr:LacI family DNA-binding transcriptional regulator [Saccharopolyspora pogona]
MAPTLTDVAKQANVALSTASRAFSDPRRLGPETLRKVLAVAQEIGYAPTPGKQTDPTPEQDATTVAIVVPDIANPVFGTFVKAAQGEVRRGKQTLVLHDTDFDPEREREAIAHLRAKADAVVMCSPRLDAEEIIELCDRTPVLLVNREAEGTDCILADASDGLRQTIDYLAALGHTRIAYVQGSEHSWSNGRRVALASALAADAGLELEILGWQAETVAGGTAAAARVVASGATAAITHNDLVAFGVIKGARALGVEVPTGLSVVGFDDTPLTDVSRPSLTSIAVPWTKAGSLSLELLGPVLAGERHLPRKHRLHTQLVVRGSTGPATAR